MNEKLPFAKNYRELIAYQKSRQLAREVFQLSRTFPKEETYSLTDQIRRASRAIGANIAEAWAKRAYEKHFISKLTDADAEQYETQHWLEVTLDCNYASKARIDPLLASCEEIGRIIGGMVNRADMFCQTSVVREPSVDYFVEESDAPN